MNNAILGYKNGKFMLGEHELKSFDIEPNSFLDMIEMNESNKVKIQLFDIQSDTISPDDNVSFDITNFIKDEAYLLVWGGWIPCTFIKRNTILLADRNVISEIRRRYEYGRKKVHEKFDAFDNIFLNPTINMMLDISAFVIEGNERKIPTNTMIDEQVISIKKDIQVALPNIKIAFYPNGNIYYHQMKDLLEPMISKRIEYLQKIAPTLNKQFTKNSRRNAIKVVFETAEKMTLDKNDIVIILALLRILMEGKKTAPQLLLKDSQNYSEGNAYNAAFDLSLIEMLINLHAFHDKENTINNVALITKDKGLSLFSSLFYNTNISNRDKGKITVNANILYEIFSDDEDMLKTYEKWFKGEIKV